MKGSCEPPPRIGRYKSSRAASGTLRIRRRRQHIPGVYRRGRPWCGGRCADSRGDARAKHPGGDELPQTFETIEELAAHPEWNALRPRQTEPQLISAATRVIYLDGIDTRLNPGDWMLLRAGDNVNPANPGVIRNVPLQVIKVDRDQERQHTRVEMVRPNARITPFKRIRLRSSPIHRPRPHTSGRWCCRAKCRCACQRVHMDFG